MEDPPKNGKPIKWKKLAAQELQSAERIPVKKLQKRMLQKTGQQGSEQAAHELLARIQGSSQLLIENGYVKLSQ